LLFYGLLRLALDPLRADGPPEHLLGLSWQQARTLADIAIAVACVLLSRRQRQIHAPSA